MAQDTPYTITGPHAASALHRSHHHTQMLTAFSPRVASADRSTARKLLQAARTGSTIHDDILTNLLLRRLRLPCLVSVYNSSAVVWQRA